MPVIIVDKDMEVWGTFTLPFPKLHLFMQHCFTFNNI